MERVNYRGMCMNPPASMFDKMGMIRRQVVMTMRYDFRVIRGP